MVRMFKSFLQAQEDGTEICNDGNRTECSKDELDVGWKIDVRFAKE